MTLDTDWRDLQATFIGELEERVRDLGSLLLRLERGEGGDPGRIELLGALFREAHNLKGAARAVGSDHVESLAHALESALTAGQSYGLQPVGPWFDAVYRAIDTLGPLYYSAVDGNAAVTIDLAGALGGLRIDPSEGANPPANGVVEVKVPPVANPRIPAAVDPAVPASTTVRVAVDKLDTLLALAGELSVAQIRIKERLRELRDLRHGFDEWRREWRGTRQYPAAFRRSTANGELVDRKAAQQLEGLLRLVERADLHAQALFQQTDSATAELAKDTAQLEMVSRDLESEVMAVRLMPVASVFGPLARLVRDLAREENKEVELVLEGAGTEIDRKILEQLRDPLMHMLRNAVDHGIESPAERQSRGKPALGTIRLVASHRGGLVAIQVEDDGAGLYPARIRETAVSKGFLTREQAEVADESAIIDLIFRPGFSTRAAVTETSGRGVGMDVVREHVESLNGQVRVASQFGHGSSFTILIPLTLATTRAILVEQSGQLFGIPSATVERTSRVLEHLFVQIDGHRTIQIEQQPVVAIELAHVLRLRAASTVTANPEVWRQFFIVRQADRRVALLVDRLIGEQEVMIKSLGWPLRRVPNVSGAALLGSGQMVVILNPSDLVETGGKLPRLELIPSDAVVVGAPVQPAPPARKRVLVVDDSVTTRTLERSILEVAGYEVLVASDGVDALNVLRREPIDLVVSDIDMPRLDGFALTAELRRYAKLT